jgi:hypothetical protein
MANGSTGERLYNLLPAIYRVRDLAQGEPLRALLAITQGEMDLIERDIEGLYDDWFIETCAEWVVPYIGDLVGVRPLHSVDSAGIFSQRAYVANTLRLRRRKGTAPVLEQLARDVTGWPARAVEFFERLITNQHVNHVRPHNRTTVELRDGNALELLGGPFETAAHTVEVRRIAAGRGKYNIPNVGLFLWRLQPYFVAQSTPRPVADPDDGRYRFSPLGNDIPLFNRPRTETEITHLAEEINVPGRLRRRALYDDLEALRQALVDAQPHPRSLFLDVDHPAFQIFVGNAAGELTAIPAEEILICDLRDVPGETDWRRPPTSKTYTSRTQFDRSVDPPVPLSEERPIQVAVDPVLGRLAFPAGIVPERVAVSYAYGFSSDIGGGPYGRRDTLTVPASTETWRRSVAQHDPAADHATLTAALAEWAAGDATDAIITITDSHTYSEAISIAMVSRRNLVIQGADGERPTLRLFTGPAELGELVVAGGDGAQATLTLNGLWIEGGLRIAADSLEQLCLEHCTLVPGRGLDAASEPRRPVLPGLVAEWPNADLRVGIRHSITGPLHVPGEITDLTAQDSIIHSPLRGGPARRTPALVSGSLATFPALTADSPAVNVQIGDEGPITATFAAKPATLAQAQDQLQAAIHTAHSSTAFTAARVITGANRLIILPGTPEPVAVTPVEGDPTGIELRLSDGSEQLLQALMTPPLAPFPTLSALTPSLNITMGEQGPHSITLTPAPTTVAAARDLLHSAIPMAHSDPAFQNAIVGDVEDRLVVLPGTAETTAVFGTTDDDPTTLLELGLYADGPALAGDDIGVQPGPKTTLERVTVFGSVHVREVALASETIFTGPAVAQRRQVGCTRFCFLPVGSRMPRRFRCQPDLALAKYAQEIGKSTADKLTAAEQEAVLARVTPTFTSVRYGDPGYAQLSRTCAEEIRTGAEDGAEMGVFQHLKQPQREANLRASLAEYLRFGLEAGLFFAT